MSSDEQQPEFAPTGRRSERRESLKRSERWAAVEREIEHDRRSEFWLILKAVIGLALVAALVVIRHLVLG